MQYIKGTDRTQAVLFPQSLDEIIEQENLSSLSLFIPVYSNAFVLPGLLQFVEATFLYTKKQWLLKPLKHAYID